MNISFLHDEYMVHADVDGQHPVHITAVTDDEDREVSGELNYKEICLIENHAYEIAMEEGVMLPSNPYDDYGHSKGDF